MELVKYLLDQGLPVTGVCDEPKMENAIIAAAAFGHLPVLQFLESLEEVSSLFDETLSIPQVACQEGRVEILDYLLKKDEEGQLHRELSVGSALE